MRGMFKVGAAVALLLVVGCDDKDPLPEDVAIATSPVSGMPGVPCASPENGVWTFELRDALSDDPWIGQGGPFVGHGDFHCQMVGSDSDWRFECEDPPEVGSNHPSEISIVIDGSVAGGTVVSRAYTNVLNCEATFEIDSITAIE